jgi:lysozyme
MRHITSEGIKLIKKYEGFFPKKYICPAGYLTIGYGHVIKDNENLNDVSEEEAEFLLKKDIEIAEISVLRNINVSLTDNQFNALVSFTFNLGGGALQRSTLRQKINRQEHYAVPDEFMKWIWCNGRRLTGLIKRRQAEAILYVT